MVRYLVLLAVLSILVSGCVVVHSEEHMAMTCAKAGAAPAALP